MVFVNQTSEISPRAIFSFLLNMRPSSILLKGPLVAEHVLSKFESQWKYRWWSTVPSSKMSKGDTRLEDPTSQTSTLQGNFSICLMAPFVSDLALRSSHFVSCKLHQCRTFFRQKTKMSACLLHESGLVSNLRIWIVLFFGLHKFLAELFSCKILVWDDLWELSEHLLRDILKSSAILRYEKSCRCLPLPLFAAVLRRPVDMNKRILPVSPIILHHLLSPVNHEDPHGSS